MDLEDFAGLRESGEEYLAACGALLGQNTANREGQLLLAQLQKKLAQDAFNVLVVGEFSAGKSTFINALLREKILPTENVATTAVVNVIQYAEEKRVCLQYRGENGQPGKKLNIPVAELPNYVTALTEAANRESQQIDTAQIYYPTEFCRQGVRLIDTPGLNSTYVSHEKATLAYLPQGSAGIMLIPATQFLSASEREYLKCFRRYMDRMFFVVTRVDEMPQDDSFADNQEYFSEELAGVLQCDPEEVTLYPVNGRLAEEGDWQKSGLDSFLQDFEEFLTTDHMAVEMLVPPLRTARQQLEVFCKNQQMRLAAMDFSFADFEQKIKENEPRRREILARRKEIQEFILRQGQDLCYASLRHSEASFEQLLDNMQEFIGGWEGDIQNDLSPALRKFIRAQGLACAAEMDGYIKEKLQAMEAEIDVRSRELQLDIEKYQLGFSSELEPVIGNGSEMTVYAAGASHFIGGFVGVKIGIAVGAVLAAPLGVIAAGVSAMLISSGSFSMLKNMARRGQLRRIADRAEKALRKEFENSTQCQLEDSLKDSIRKYSADIAAKYEAMVASVDDTIAAIRKEKLQAQARTEQEKLQIEQSMEKAQQLQRAMASLCAQVGGTENEGL